MGRRAPATPHPIAAPTHHGTPRTLPAPGWVEWLTRWEGGADAGWAVRMLAGTTEYLIQRG
ncbi:hypothetical protein Misp04_32060 [Micromonospora sp. NBRC 101691]|nr:hypothetical protein Misp04_32060 [Micromonospora sp. NBRC 101691]